MRIWPAAAVGLFASLTWGGACFLFGFYAHPVSATIATLGGEVFGAFVVLFALYLTNRVLP